MSDFHSDHKRQLMSAAEALFGSTQARPSRVRHRARRPPVLVAIALGSLLLAAAAYAAGHLIGIGAPVRPSQGSERSSRTAGIGEPVRGADGASRTDSLLPISVADPAGGLRWGMRIVTTTRGLLCLQVGRLLNDHLGILGQDGRFKDDGLFHELPPGALDQSLCSQPDLVVLYTGAGLPAAGMSAGDEQTCAYPVSMQLDVPSCPAGDERMIAFGLLGPNARSVSYRADGRLHTMATSGSDGAYLIVLAQPPQALVGGGVAAAAFVSPGQLPAAATKAYLLSTIVFRKGSRRCQIGSEELPAGPPACDSIGASAVSTVKIFEAHTPVALRTLRTRDGYKLDLTFRAPVTVDDATSAYAAEYSLPRGHGCSPVSEGQPIERDITRGQMVHVTMLVSSQRGCTGRIAGRVVVGRQSGALSGPTYDERAVGDFSMEMSPTGGS
jgi:hypothetical protein